MKLFITLFLILNFNISFADEYLIQEMEALKSTLEKNDPDRVILSLRLADLYFDVSIQEGSGDQIIVQRENSYKLYTDVLYGRDGLKKAGGLSAIKIKFQLARVLSKLNRVTESKKYYLEVFQDEKSSKKFKRESALALAEFYEEDVNFAKADKFYRHGIELCESLETCNYAHYKRAWLFYKEVRLDEAIVELKMSLWDSKKQARDKVINDLLLFFSAAVTDGHKELDYISELAEQTKQPELVRKLVESFYATGNRIAGSNVLVEWNKQNPSLFYELRLLEEYYGFRNWEKVNIYMSAVEKRTSSDIPKDPEEAKETKAMQKRLIVQLDSEVQQDSKYANELLRSIDIYLGFYANDDMRKKLQQGWLKVQTDNLKKIDRLALWIKEDIAFGMADTEIRKLRQSRLSLAQKEKKSTVVIKEASELAKIVSKEEAREFKYVYAHENYLLKKNDIALPVFLELAKLTENSNIVDDWGIKSQNLALDIYNSNKNFKALTAQAALWTVNPQLSANPKLTKEIGEMKKVQTQAQFEYTASLGESTKALDQFFNFCFEKVYEKKSCANAKVLSIKLGDQLKLVALLEREKDEKALMSEYEMMGRFSSAAKLNEKFNLTKSADISVYLKIALLYELDQNLKQRDRILNKLIAKIKRERSIDSKWESALYLTLNEADLINAKTLGLNWSLPIKLKIASLVENKSATKILTAGFTYTGPHWAKSVLSKIQKLDEKQKKISFYGRRSQTLFKRRVRAIEKLKENAQKYLEGSDAKTRVYLLDILKKAYLGFATEILSTPLPEGLTDEVMAQVIGQLNQMAAPYSQVAADYTKLQGEQLLTIEAKEQTKMKTELSSAEISYADLIIIEKIENTELAIIDEKLISPLKQRLSLKPNNISTLKEFESLYKENSNPRLTAYFTGRINSLKEQND